MTFEESVEVVLAHEGGYVNDPRDPGGETKFGISRKAYPDLDIANLTRDQAIYIYRRDYWARAKCDGLPGWARLTVFDAAVNQGVGRGVSFLQKAVGTAADGVVGPGTIAAARRVAPEEGLRKMTIERIEHYVKLAGFRDFGYQWLWRALRTYELSLPEVASV